MKKTILLLMVLNILSKPLGFARELALSYFFGASNITDAYLVSSTIPNLLITFLAGAVGITFIPMFNNIRSNGGEVEAIKFTHNLINLLTIASLIAAIISIVFATPLVKLVASGFDSSTLKLAVNFSRIYAVGTLFTGYIVVFPLLQRIKGDFLTQAITAFPTKICITLSIVIGYFWNVYMLIVGSVIAVLIQFCIMYIGLARNGYKHRLYISTKDDNIKEMLRLAFPVILGSSVSSINLLIDRTLASRITVGGISALNYATTALGIISGLLVVPVLTVMYPRISEQASENDTAGLKKTLQETIINLLIITLPAIIGIIVFSEQTVSFLFGRGAFDEIASALTSSVLFFYAPSTIFGGLRSIFSNTLYSLQDTKTPMTNSVIGVVINIALNLILSHYIGIAGLALATSISAFVTAILMIISVRKKIGSFGMKKATVSLIKITVASAIMGMFAKTCFNTLATALSQSVSLLIAIAIGALSYCIIILFMKIDDVDVVVAILKKKTVAFISRQF